jgi:hypothetical protein
MDGRGRGLFTVCAVRAGLNLCWFEGDVVRRSELGGVGGSELAYVVMVEPGLFLRAVQDGHMSLAWFANHTCVGANARIVVVGSGLSVRAVLRSLREIGVGEEVLVDYRLSGVEGQNKNLSSVILFGSSEEGALLAGSLCRDEDWS